MTDSETLEQVRELLERQAILDTITRYARAMDRLDEELFKTAYHADAVDDHGVFVGARDEFYPWVSKLLSEQRSSTQHVIGNFTVEIDGHSAHAETYFIAPSMVAQGYPFSLVGGRWLDRLVKEDGRWQILARLVVTDWQMPTGTQSGDGKDGDGASLAHFQPMEREIAASRQLSRRDRQDPSYTRPLEVSPERLAAYQELKKKYGVSQA